MNKPGLFALAAQIIPRMAPMRRGWIMLGAGLLVLLGLLTWAAVALIGWLLGQAQGLVGAAPEVARGALERVEQAMPGAREKLGELVPALDRQDQPRRDVSGADLAPVARYPGLTRTYWQRQGGQVKIEYEGKADYAAVLGHYAKGFADLGFAQNVQSATPEAETHEYAKARQRYLLKIAETPKGFVVVRIETTLD